MADVDSPTTDLCPLQDRRTTRELLVKLVVVHFTILCAYAHLLKIRGQRTVWRIFGFIICPLLPVWHITASALGLAWYQFSIRGEPEKAEKFGRAVGYIFGRHKAQLAPGEDHIAWPPKALGDKFWNTVANIGLICQCTASVYLFARRRSRDSQTSYDLQILELALGGLCIGLLTILHDFLDPQASAGSESGLFQFLRPSLKPDDAASKNKRDETNSIEWLHILITSLTISAALAHLAKFELASTFFAWVYFQLLGIFKELLGTTFFVILLIFAVVSAGVLSAGLLSPGGYVLLMFLNLPTFSYLGCMLVWIYVSPLLSRFTEYATLFGEVTQLTSLPADKPCPQAWSDPQSKYIWWLA